MQCKFSLKGSIYAGYVFTEQGVAGISGVLTSDRTIAVNISIMRTFVEMRRFLAANGELLKRLDTLEKRQIIHEIKATEQFERIFAALENKSSTYTQGILFDHTTYFEIGSIIH